MSKALFRFLRGELNGYYLQNIYNTLNRATEDIKSFLIETQKEQFTKDKVRSSTLHGLGKFAGIFLPRVSTTDSMISLYMTDSEIIDGTEFSERGLFNKSKETFKFYHTDTMLEYPDINTLATEEERSSLVGEDDEVIGYISADAEDVVDSEGNVRADVILETPPEEGAYSEFYGNKFLVLAEGVSIYSDIEDALYLELYKALQIVRYNGASLNSLCEIINILCPNGLVQIDRIEVGIDRKHINVYYIFNTEAEGTVFRQQRLYLLKYLIEEKFKQIILLEINPLEE